jgi:hypothetical protein
MADTNNSLLNAVRVRQKRKSEFGYGIWTADRYVRTLAEVVGLEQCYKKISNRNVSFNDVMTKAASTLVYSNPEMVVDSEFPVISDTTEKATRLPSDIELPKNTLLVFKHTLTTSRKDRDGDILRTDGMEVDPNMLLLWQHVHTLPIGKMLKVHKQTKNRLDVFSCIVDMNELAHDAAVMIENKMGRFSHGFRALKYERIEEDDYITGFDILKAEIMEESLVSVPSNIDAETQEVLMSLVDSKQLKSEIMQEYGRAIKSGMPITVPVKIDLKLTVNGKETNSDQKDVDQTPVENEEEHEEPVEPKTEPETKQNTTGESTPKETDGPSDENKEVGATKDHEVIEAVLEDREVTVDEAMQVFLAKASTQERHRMFTVLSAMHKVDKSAANAARFRKHRKRNAP